MGVKLIFTVSRETIAMEVVDRIITYSDRKLKDKIQMIPKDPGFDRLVLMSRNRIPKEIIELVNDSNRGKNLEEYNSAKTEEDLIKIIIKDAREKGCVFQGRLEI